MIEYQQRQLHRIILTAPAILAFSVSPVMFGYPIEKGVVNVIGTETREHHKSNAILHSSADDHLGAVMTFLKFCQVNLIPQRGSLSLGLFLLHDERVLL